MKKLLPTLLLLAAAVALPAHAQGSVGASGPKAAATDCKQSPQPERCAARQRATDICKGKSAAQRRQCMQETMPSVDCSKSRNPQRCELMHQAQAACQDKFGPALRQCIEAQTGDSKAR